MDTIGSVWMAKAQAKVRPRSYTRGPKIQKMFFFFSLEGNIHILPTFCDSRPCGFDRSLKGLGGFQGRPGASLGAPKLTLGRLGGVPSERASHLKAPREGLGTHFGDPMECAYSPNAHICEVF